MQQDLRGFGRRILASRDTNGDGVRAERQIVRDRKPVHRRTIRLVQIDFADHCAVDQDLSDSAPGMFQHPQSDVEKIARKLQQIARRSVIQKIFPLQMLPISVAIDAGIIKWNTFIFDAGKFEIRKTQAFPSRGTIEMQKIKLEITDNSRDIAAGMAGEYTRFCASIREQNARSKGKIAFAGRTTDYRQEVPFGLLHQKSSLT